MALFTGTRLNRTPTGSQDEWTLDADSGEVGALYFVEAASESTTTAAMRTRWCYSTGSAGALSTLSSVEVTDPVQHGVTNLIDFGSPYASPQPTLANGDWYAEGWNALGGLVRYQAALPQDELIIIGPKTVSCRNVTGTAVSDFIAKWREF